MSKSPEEIKDAVLKCCETVTRMHDLEIVEYFPQLGIQLDSLHGAWRFCEMHPDLGWHVTLSIYPELLETGKNYLHHPDWIKAYHLLNIEGRELEEKYNALLKLSNQIQEKADSIEERTQGLVDALKNANLAIIDVLQHGDSSDKLRIAHKINSEALNQWKGGGNG